MAVQIGGMPPPPLPTTRTTTVSVGVSAPRAPIATASTTVVLAPPPESEPVSTFFDAPVFAAPAGVVFVLDRSGSMNDALRSPHETRPMGRSFRHASKLQRAKQELLAALADLPDGTRVNVVFFSGSSRAFRADPITLDALSRRGLDATVAHTVAGGRTDLADALDRALAMRPAQVVLLTDGRNSDGMGPVQEAFERHRAQGTRIDAVALGALHDRQLLQALTAASGGTYRAQ